MVTLQPVAELETHSKIESLQRLSSQADPHVSALQSCLTTPANAGCEQVNLQTSAPPSHQTENTCLRERKGERPLRTKIHSAITRQHYQTTLNSEQNQQCRVPCTILISTTLLFCVTCTKISHDSMYRQALAARPSLASPTSPFSSSPADLNGLHRGDNLWKCG